MINLCVLLCGCASLSFSDPFVYGYDVMMINVFRYCMTIEILTYTWIPTRQIYSNEKKIERKGKEGNDDG